MDFTITCKLIELSVCIGYFHWCFKSVLEVFVLILILLLKTNAADINSKASYFLSLYGMELMLIVYRDICS